MNSRSYCNMRKGVLSELKILSKKVSDLDQTVKNTDIKIDRILERLAETNTSKTVKARAAPEVPAEVQKKTDIITQDNQVVDVDEETISSAQVHASNNEDSTSSLSGDESLVSQILKKSTSQEKNYQTKTEGHRSSSESTIDYDVESYKLLENNVETTSSAQVHASNNEDSTSNSSEDESIFSQILNKNQTRKTIKPKLKFQKPVSRLLDMINALNASKSRIMLKLKKFAMKLEKEQVYEPVDTLFIIRKRGTHVYRCFGYGELGERFINGEVLTDYPPYANRKEQSMPEVEKDTKVKFLTPGKDPFSFSRGSGKTLAERQKDKLDNLPIRITPDEVNVRIVKNLQKFATTLQKEQIYEPVDTLFLIRRKGSTVIKACGYGDMMKRFSEGLPITDAPPYSHRRKLPTMPEVTPDQEVIQLKFGKRAKGNA
ncbi:unnamed protein product [Mytilus edulis]|uniref:Uncharacterized protein n=1 Tax=Mytilus edulis TaxID=6550 RepID=A0A8S3S8F6_MYTED|nr:unnamed protein product [Mytilus edulis]